MIYIDDTTTVLNLPRTLGQRREGTPAQYYTKAEIDAMMSAVDGRLDAIEDGDMVQLNLTAFTKVAINYYISMATNKWEASSQSTTFFLPVIAGRKYRIEPQHGRVARYAVLKSYATTGIGGTSPDYAGMQTMREITEETDVVIPGEGRYLAVNMKISGTDVTPTIYLYSEIIEPARYSVEMVLQESQRIDCRTSSVNFGSRVAATNATWGASQAIWVKDAVRIRYFGSNISTSANYYNWTGTIFYDEHFRPMTDGLFLIKRGDSAYTGWMSLDVPDGACYVIVTSPVAASVKTMEVYYTAQDDVYGIAQTPALPYTYSGEPIVINDRKYNWSKIGTRAVNGQSSASYGDYLIIVQEFYAKVILYNLRTGAVLYQYSPGFAYESFWHCNQSSFGTLRVSADDYFPVLYVSMQNDGDGRGLVHACRIVPTFTNGEISSFTLTIVQSIHLPVMTDDNCLGNPNWTYDAENDCVWVYSRNNNNLADNYHQAKFTKFAVPSLDSDVTLEDTDILDSFSDNWSMLNAQGGAINNGRLYIVQGYIGVGYVWLRGIDLYAQRRQVTLLDMYRDGVPDEPEGVFIYDGCVCFSTNTKTVYKITVK